MSILQGAAKQKSVRSFYPKTINGSLRFNDDDSAYLSWTPDSAGNRKTWTWSGWVKRGNIKSARIDLFSADGNTATTNMSFGWNSGDQLFFGNWSSDQILVSTQVFRDPSAWYHIVVQFDSTQATASDRVKFYVNGSRLTAVTDNISTYISQNTDYGVNNTSEHNIGQSAYANNFIWDGYLAEVHFTDGTAYDADAFGEFKEGVWVAKAPDVDYGTNGFYLDFQDDTEVEAFNTTLHRGNGGVQSVTGMGFQPDLVLVKSRDATNDTTIVVDSVRGAGLDFHTVNAESEHTGSANVNSFDSDGFTLGGGGYVNGLNEKFVTWGWKAGGSSNTYNVDGTGYASMAAAGLTDGDIALTGLSVNTTYGFSIVSYTCPATTVKGDTIAHGLGVAPDFMIFKGRNNATGRNWGVYHKDIGRTGGIVLNSTGEATTSDEWWNNTNPTSTEVTLGRFSYVQEDGYNYIAYCWADTSGNPEGQRYSKFGFYSGDSTTDGSNAINVGFKPALVIIKHYEDTAGSYGGDWYVYDNTRDVVDGDGYLRLNSGAGETANGGFVKLTDTGFALYTNSGSHNETNNNYIYAAFADTREAAFWLDQSGNDNDWQPVNLDHNDTVADSPTNNFCTMNPLDSLGTLADGNLKYTTVASGYGMGRATQAFKTGKWYWEITVNAASTAELIGVIDETAKLTSGSAVGYLLDGGVDSIAYYANGNKYINGTGTSYGASFTVGDVIGVALNLDDDEITFYKNGVSQGVISYTFSGNYIFPALSDGTGSSTLSVYTANFGQQPFKYDPPA